MTSSHFAYNFLAKKLISLISATLLRKRSFMRCSMYQRRNKNKLFGVLIVIGINPVSLVRLYWSSEDMLKNDLIKKIMTRERFDMLLKCLHLNNDAEERFDMLLKCLHFNNDAEEVIDEPSLKTF